MDKLVIAIDGPASSGKSTIAKRVAKHFNIVHIDSGSMYRAVGYYMLRHNVDINDEKSVVKRLDDVSITIKITDGVNDIYLGEEKITDKIRTQEVGEAASVVSAYLAVREKLVREQQKLASEISVVMDGRDIGTVVLKDADLKIFLVCDVEERAKRRYKELLEKGVAASYEEVLEELKIRDKRDSTRKNSPLVKADDAVTVDSTFLSPDEVIERIISILG